MPLLYDIDVLQMSAGVGSHTTTCRFLLRASLAAHQRYHAAKQSAKSIQSASVSTGIMQMVVVGYCSVRILRKSAKETALLTTIATNTVI